MVENEEEHHVQQNSDEEGGGKEQKGKTTKKGTGKGQKAKPANQTVLYWIIRLSLPYIYIYGWEANGGDRYCDN